MDEKLRFVIDLQNKASAELKKLSKDMDGVKPGAGMKNTASWFQTLETASVSATKSMRPLLGGLNMIGAGGLAAGLSVAGLVSQFRDLARAMPAMQELSRQTGISKTELARLQYAASKLHIDPSKMTNALGTWSEGMVLFSKQSGDVYREMQNGSGPLAEKIAKEWKDHPEAAFKDTLAWLAAIPEASQRAGKSMQEATQIQKYWVGKTLGDEGMTQFFGKGMEGINGALDEAAKRVAPITDDLERAAEKFDDSITNLNTSWANIVRDLGPSFLDPLSHAIDHLDEVLKAGEKMFQHQPEPTPPRQPDGKSGESITEWLARTGRNTLRAQFNGSGMAADGQWLWDNLFGSGQAHAAEMPGGASDAARGTPSVPAFHPDDDDRQTRTRARDVPDRSLDGFVLGSLEKPILHLSGSLKTAAAQADDGIHPAAFHPAGGRGLTSMLDVQGTITAGVKEGVLAAYRELSGLSGDGAGGGFTNASFGGGGVSSSAAGRRPSIRYGRQHSSTPYDDGGATPTGAHDPLKDLIAAHETGSVGAAGYDTVYGHAEQPGSKMAALAPPKPISQMTIADVLAYQRAMKPRAGSPAFPVGRAQWTESTLRGLTRGMDPSTVFSPEVQEKLFDRSIAGRMGQGPSGFRSEWDSLRGVPDGEIDRAVAGHHDALRSAAPVAAGPDGVSGHVRGNLKVGDEVYPYGSGGVRGAAHIPYGDYPIKPDSGNPWGQAHNAMDVNDTGSVWDKSLGRMRTGIEMHVAHSANMITEGCLAFLKDQYPQLKSRVKEMIAKTGHAYLHIDEKGASITPDRIAPMPKIAPEPSRRPEADAASRPQIDPMRLDIHHHESGRTRLSAKSGPGVQISIKTAPTLVQTA